MDKEKKTNDDIDRLSGLPDSLLTNNILSLLKARELIQTCVLSKRWLKLWAYVPCLKFYFNEFRNKRINNGNSDRDLERFRNFVSLFLQLRDSAIDIDVFSVYCGVRSETEPDTINSGHVTSWILYALKHNVKNLDVDLVVHEPIDMPDSLFICETLENLSVNIYVGMDIFPKIKPDRICLPRLKTLYFHDVHLNGNCMEKLLLGCPVLESLIMKGCMLKMNNISSQTLKKLLIDGCVLVSKKLFPRVFTICTPNVKILDFGFYLGDDNMKITFKSMPNVQTVLLSVDFREDYYHFLSGLSGIEDLSLRSEGFEEMLKGELPNLPTFRNLKCLSLGKWCMTCIFGLVISFLNHCPNLESLTLVHFNSDCEDHERHENGQIPPEVENILCKNLKAVTVTYLEMDYSTAYLLDLITASTKEIGEVELILEEM